MRRGAGARREAFLFKLGGAGAASGDERARRCSRRSRRWAATSRARRWRSANWRAPEGRGARWTRAARARRARRRGHADRRELQRQSRGDGGGLRGARRRPARGRRRAGSPRGRRVAFLGDMLELGPQEARAARRARRRRRRCAASRPSTAPARGCARCTRRCPRRSAASGSPTPPRWRRAPGGCSTPATSRWSRARTAAGSAWSLTRSRQWARPRPRRTPGRLTTAMLYYLAELSQNLERVQPVPLHHLPRRRRVLHRAGLRLPVRPAADRVAARAAGPRPADPQRTGRRATSDQGGHADDGRAADPVGDPGLDAALGAAGTTASSGWCCS